jgi:hypothetical protein
MTLSHHEEELSWKSEGRHDTMMKLTEGDAADVARSGRALEFPTIYVLLTGRDGIHDLALCKGQRQT